MHRRPRPDTVARAGRSWEEAHEPQHRYRRYRRSARHPGLLHVGRPRNRANPRSHDDNAGRHDAARDQQQYADAVAADRGGPPRLCLDREMSQSAAALRQRARLGFLDEEPGPE